VRAIDAFVDSLDLPALGFKTRNDSSEGCSSNHPGSLLKLYLWGYLKRTRSSRGLENACTENFRAIWLTGKLRSDHSTISVFRKNHSAGLKGILREFNLICFSLRLFGRELVIIDGTFIKAVNSPTRSFTQAKHHLIATIKGRHGYTGLLCREIKFAAAEMNLSAWAYNFTRVVNLVRLDMLLGAIRVRNAPPLT
jgi:transposase